MPYVEGFGTWPFGEEWLLEAIAIATCRCSSCSSAGPSAGEHGVADGRGHARPGRPARAARGRASGSSRFMHGTRCECHRARHRRAGARRTARGRGGACASRRATTSAPRRRSSAPGRPARRPARAAGQRHGRAVGVRRRPMPCCRCSRPRPGCGCRSRTGIDSHRAARSAPGAAASGCRSAPTGRARRAARRAGVRAFCVDQTRAGDPLDQLEPVATGRPGRGADRLETISLVWDDRGYPGRPGLSRLPRTDDQRHAGVGERRRALRPRGGAAARARARRATSSTRSPRARPLPRRARPAGRWSSARSTRSCSGTGGTRGRSGSTRWSRRPDARAGARHSAGGARTARAASGRRARSRRWGDGQGPAHLGLSARSRTSSGPARRAELRAGRRACRRRAAGRGRAVPRAAPPGSCWHCSRATGRSWRRAAWRRTTRSDRVRGHARRVRAGAGRDGGAP